MAIFHIVWIKFNPSVDDERIRAHIAALSSLPEHIAEIRDFSIGENFTDRADGCSHGLVVKLGNRNDLQVYATHEHHVRVASALREDAALLVMDYEA